MKPTAERTVLSLFSGTGGLDLGLEAAGFDILGTVEMDALARDALALHWPKGRRADHDVVSAAMTMQPADLGLRAGELGVVAGGPPCQPFSTAAQWAKNGRSGMLDPRAGTVQAMLRILDTFLPRALLIENVLGFVQGAASAEPVLTAGLAQVNKRHGTRYELQWSIVDAADYGVPQHRRRVIAVAARDGETFQMPPPTHAGPTHVSAWDALSVLPVTKSPPPARGKWSELLPSVPEGWNYQWFTSRGGGPELFGYRTRYWTFLLKLSRERPSWTISASPGPSTGPFHWEGRPLTTPELLRLQSFPHDWALPGNARQQVRLIGNATPPLLGEVIGLALRTQVFRNEGETKTPSLTVAKSCKSPQPAKSPPPVPKHYLKLAGTKAAHAGSGKGPAARLSG